MSDKQDAWEAVAEAWASIDGKLDAYKACREDPKREHTEGYFEGYLADASELITRLGTRGFEVVKK